MRVLLVNAYCPPFAPGGAEFSMIALADGLARAGVRVGLITPHYGIDPEIPEGVEPMLVPSEVRLKSGQDCDLNAWVGSPAFHESMAARISSEWERGTIVHLQGATVVSAGLEARRRGCRPVLLTVRDTAALCPTGWCLMKGGPGIPRSCRNLVEHFFCSWNFGRRQLGRPGLMPRIRQQVRFAERWRRTVELRDRVNRLDGLVAVSGALLQILRANGVGDVDSSGFVYNLPPRTWPAPSEDELGKWRAKLGLGGGLRLVLVVGKRSVGKGTPVLRAAMERVHQVHRDAICVSVGKGPVLPETGYWRSLAPVSQSDLRALYALSSFVVIPSVWPEPFSRVLLEAMMARKPVLAAETGGSPEGIRDGVTGWLVRPWDVDALAGKILEGLALSASELNAMGEANHRIFSRKFDASESISALMALYEKAGKERKAQPCPSTI